MYFAIVEAESAAVTICGGAALAVLVGDGTVETALAGIKT